MSVVNFKAGDVYFFVRYCDVNRTIPKIDTLEFVGRNASADNNVGLGEGYYLFSEAGTESRSEMAELLARKGIIDEGERVISSEVYVPDSAIDDVYDLSGLIDVLSSIARIRKK